MRVYTRITAMARARGLTAAEVARRAGLYRSNLSAMDGGNRAVSLRTLARVARVLSCSISDLLEVHEGSEAPVFRGLALNRRLSERDLGAPDGLETGWVHAVQMAWRRHYHGARPRA